ncbi:MAG: hypothetical protein ACK4SY_10095, partial [Pyrobaculum sp.]
MYATHAWGRRGWLLIAVLLLAAATYASNEMCTVDTSLIAKMFATFSLLDVPLPAQARYDLFHTAYITERGISIVNYPLIPGEEVREMLATAQLIREMIQNGTIRVAANETGLYAYYNGNLTLAIEKTTSSEEADIYFDEWTSIKISENTWLNYTNVYMRGGEFLLLYYVKYVSETHRLYVITLAKKGDGGYDYLVGWANYWFKDKQVYFGDWIVAKNLTLSQFFTKAADAVDRLKREWDASDRQYKPQAYPQIAQSLREIARTIGGTSIDLPIKNATMLVTDVPI